MNATSAPAVPTPISVGHVRARAARRRTIVVAGVATALLVTAAVSLALGDYGMSPSDVWRTLWGGGSRVEDYVVFQVRTPRLAMALLVGAALGIAGALLQTLLGNPLASPDLLGISGGAGVAAVFGILVLGIGGPALALVAFLGGIAVAIFLLLSGRRDDGVYRVIVAGIGISFLSAAVTGYLMVRSQIELAQTALVWLTGSLASTPWWTVGTLLAVMIAALPAIMVSARWLPVVQLGTTAATALGVRPERVRVLAVTVAVLLTATTCAFVGPIAFIALCAPAISRPLLGHGAVGIGTSAALGAALLSAADLVAQYAIPGVSVPVGVVTGGVGALFLLWLLATSKGRHL